jgi:hypothetical protein
MEVALNLRMRFMSFNTCLFLSIFLIASCSTLPKQSFNPNKNDATKFAHQQTIEVLNKSDKREPASPIIELNAKLQSLQKLSPAKFEVYVFPKVNSKINKDLKQDEEYLTQPKVFEISIVAVNPCRQFIHKSLFSKLNPKQVFPESLGVDDSRHCAILEVLDKNLAQINKSLLKADDQLAQRLFIDDEYTVYAIDHTIFESTNKFRMIRRIIEEDDFGSGLSLFPIDLPKKDAITKEVQLSKSYAKKLDSIALYQIQNRYNKNFASPNCLGVQFTSIDPLGGSSDVGWCKSMPWPSFSDNSRFFSVTQPLSIR